MYNLVHGLCALLIISSYYIGLDRKPTLSDHLLVLVLIALAPLVVTIALLITLITED